MKRILSLIILLAAVLTMAAQSYSPCYTESMKAGNTAYNQGKYKEAIRYYEGAKQCHGGNPEAAQKRINDCNAKIRAQQTGTAYGHDWVDLGLPSGTRWATCNVGASKPEGCGNRYAWGETNTKSTSNWNNYKYANGNEGELTKYCNKSRFGDNGFTDNLTSLQREDDPAAVWGSGWHTPSKDQWDELLANTTYKMTTRNGVKGMLFTSKKNGQTLFLPALFATYGSYWSRSLNTDFPRYAWNLYFADPDGCHVSDFGSGYRYAEKPVRPVREK